MCSRCVHQVGSAATLPYLVVEGGEVLNVGAGCRSRGEPPGGSGRALRGVWERPGPLEPPDGQTGRGRRTGERRFWLAAAQVKGVQIVQLLARMPASSKVETTRR